MYVGFQNLVPEVVSALLAEDKNNDESGCPDVCPEAICALFEHSDLARIVEKWDELPASVRLGVLAIVEGV